MNRPSVLFHVSMVDASTLPLSARVMLAGQDQTAIKACHNLESVASAHELF